MNPMPQIKVPSSSLAIGLGIACFGLGFLMHKISDGDDRDPTGDSEEREALTAISVGGKGEEFSGGSSSAGSQGRAGKLPASAKIFAAIDILDDQRSIQQLAPLLKSLGADQLEELLFAIERDGTDPERYRAIKFIGEHFGKTDPRAAFEFASKPVNENLARGMLEAAIKTMMRDSPDEALAAVKGIGDRKTKKDAMVALIGALVISRPELIRSWLEDEDMKAYLTDNSWSMRSMLQGMANTSPVEAADFALSLPQEELRKWGIQGVAAGWVQHDPTAALAWVKSIEDGMQRREAIRSMIGEVLLKDPKAAFAMVDESEGEDRNFLVKSISYRLAQRDPDKALEWASSLEDPYELQLALDGISGVPLSEAGVDQLLGLMGTLPDEKRKQAGIQLVSHWIKRDPKAASDWVAAVEDLDEKKGYIQQMVGSVSFMDPGAAVALISRFSSSLEGSNLDVTGAFSRLAKKDLETAREAAVQMPEGNAKQKAMSGVVDSWAMNEPAAAAAFVLEEYGAGAKQREMIATVSSRWVGRDPEGAITWANGLEVEDRVAASDQIISTLAYRGNTELAQSTLVTLLEEHPDEACKAGRLSSALHAVMFKAGSDDPQEGISIINQLTSHAARITAIHPLVSSWTDEQPAEARDWVDQLDTGELRDSAAKSVAHGLVKTDGPAAFELAMSIENEQVRAATLRGAVVEWAKTDAGAASIDVDDVNQLSDGEILDLVEGIE